MTYKVFFDTRPVLLSDRMTEGQGLPFYHFSYANVPKLLFRLENGEFPGLFFYHFQPAKAWERFLQYFDVIDAAGGVIFNRQGEILFLRRRGIWDLPKGKLEPHETRQEAAIREVMEETGISRPQVVRPLGETYHVFWEDRRRKMKRTAWFLMRSDDERPLQITGVEGIESLEWLAPDDRRLNGQLFRSTMDLLSRLDSPPATE